MEGKKKRNMHGGRQGEIFQESKKMKQEKGRQITRKNIMEKET